MAKQSVTLEVLSYHASASTDDAVRLMVSFIAVAFIMMTGVALNILCSFLITAPQNPIVSIFSTPRFRFWWPESGWWWYTESVLTNVPRLGFGRTFSYRLRDALPMAAERQEELSECDLSQLATCIQRRPNDVLYLDIDAVVEGVWGNWVPCSDDRLLMPWFGPPRD